MSQFSVQEIKECLEKEIPDSVVTVRDDSEKHRGHSGFVEGQVTHIDLMVVSNEMAQLSRIDRQRSVNALLKPFFDKGLHAVSLNFSDV